MTENKGDLISREALKKAIYEWRYHGYYDKLIEVIDNAPTVEIDEDTAKEVLNKRHLAVIPTETLIALQLSCGKPRPKGKWELHGMIWYCSNCGKDCEQGGNNFCGQCGAEMRGKEE